MRNHIAFKFLAVLLATLTLFGILCSVGGIFIFTAADLYEHTPQERLEEERQGLGSMFASLLAENYANENLGSCPVELLSNSRQYYFNHGFYGYILKDAAGNVLDALEGRRTDGLVIPEENEDE